jgi:D-sedoheptulose 7-phosphate isomerase
MNLLDRIEQTFSASMNTQQATLTVQHNHIALAAQMMTHCLLAGGKILSCGNGASASDAEHFTTLMLHRFETDRPGLPAITLTHTSTLSAIAEDGQREQIFAKQVQTLAHSEDILLVIGRDGNTSNLIEAVKTGHQRGLHVVALSGHSGGELALHLAPDDIEIRIPSESTPRIQEMHRLVIHCLCDLIDHQLLGA